MPRKKATSRVIQEPGVSMTLEEARAAALANPSNALGHQTKEVDIAAILTRLEALTERVATAESENARLEAALKEAKDTGTFTDEFGQVVKILDRSMENTNAGMHDRPGTLIETLDIMEKQAKIRREPFDRERTRKILCGEPVEELCLYICDRCGRSEEKWNTHPDLFDDHIQEHLTGKKRAYGKRSRIRAVDAEDDEAVERALFERLAEKYNAPTAVV